MQRWNGRARESSELNGYLISSPNARRMPHRPRALPLAACAVPCRRRATVTWRYIEPRRPAHVVWAGVNPGAARGLNATARRRVFRPHVACAVRCGRAVAGSGAGHTTEAPLHIYKSMLYTYRTHVVQHGNSDSACVRREEDDTTHSRYTVYSADGTHGNATRSARRPPLQQDLTWRQLIHQQIHTSGLVELPEAHRVDCRGKRGEASAADSHCLRPS